LSFFSVYLFFFGDFDGDYSFNILQELEFFDKGPSLPAKILGPLVLGILLNYKILFLVPV
jgi:hypothetical protein